jgi:Nucleotidyltransferase substrate binding protein like
MPHASCTSLRTCFRAAFRHGALDDDPFWIDVTVLRNYTVHTYNEELADYVYSRLIETAEITPSQSEGNRGVQPF